MSVSWSKIRKQIENQFPNGYVAAVSGGSDSMFMLDFLIRSKTKFTVVHFNHKIRDTADRDEHFVVDYCRERNIECVVGYGNSEKILSAPSIESECRNQRYDFMKTIVAEKGYDRIMTCHHASDQTETVLMRLLRGVEFDNLPMKIDNGFIYRPFLGVKKEDMVKNCQARGIPWVEDESNTDTRFERNWLRAEVIPLLRTRRNPDVIAKTAMRINERNMALERAMAAE